MNKIQVCKDNPKVFKMPCLECRPGEGDNYNAWWDGMTGKRETMICGHKPCLKKGYCLLLSSKLVKREK